MATQAYSAYGVQVRVGDGVAAVPLTITAATNTTPIVVTTSTPHGVADVSYATVAGVVGNLGANGSWVVQAVTTTTLILRNSIGTGAYTSGGTVVKLSTFASIASLRSVEGAGSRTDLVDVSSHDGNGYSSEIPTLKRTNALRLDVNLVPSQATQSDTTGLLFLHKTKAYRHWLLVLPPYPVTGRKSTGHLYGTVTYYTTSAPVNGAQQAQFELAFDGAFDWTS